MHARAAGLLYGPEFHHLDHLAPLCHLMQIPLCVTEEEIASSARKYYPRVDIQHVNYVDLPSFLVQNFEVIFTCLPRPLFDEIFFFAQKLAQKRLRTIWTPHGNSDKGHQTPFMEGLQEEEIALVYGQKMIDFFRKKHVLEKLKAFVKIDNLRYHYFDTHRSFYRPLVEKEITNRLPSNNKTILFAPTWQDAENSSSFFDAATPLIEKLPDEYNLIIKLHPNLLAQNETLIEKYIESVQEKQNILFLSSFPPIYPLLECVDLYLGDMSSIGYDFLRYDKPMFFLNQNERDAATDLGLYLFRCGKEIKRGEYDQIYSLIEKEQKSFTSLRKEVYDYTFSPWKSFESLRSEILKLFDLFTDDELEIYRL